MSYNLLHKRGNKLFLKFIEQNWLFYTLMAFYKLLFFQLTIPLLIPLTIYKINVTNKEFSLNHKSIWVFILYDSLSLQIGFRLKFWLESLASEQFWQQNPAFLSTDVNPLLFFILRSSRGIINQILDHFQVDGGLNIIQSVIPSPWVILVSGLYHCWWRPFSFKPQIQRTHN